jgi:ABC-type multidrug transport system fused ATPase/permease subunit
VRRCTGRGTANARVSWSAWSGRYRTVRSKIGNGVPLSWNELRRKGLKQIEQSIRHAGVTAWLLRDFVRFLGWRSLAITATGIASVGVKFGAAGLLYAFVDALAEQETLQLPGFPNVNIDLREFFVVGVIVGLTLMAVSTALKFQVRLIAIRAARRYEEYCTRRFINLASRLPHQKAVWATEAFKAQPLQALFSSVRATALLARGLTRLLPSLISFGLACLVLVWLNPATTASLAVVALLVMLAQYPLNNRAARASTKSEQHRREASQRLGQLLNQLRQGPVPLAPDGEVLNALFERRGPLGRDLEIHSRRIDGGVFALMVSRLGTHLLLGMVLLALGLDIIAGRQSWANVAVYVALVQFALSDFLSIGKLLSYVSKHYGPVGRYMNFVRSASRASAPASAEAATLRPLMLHVPAMDGAEPSFRPAEGDAVAVFIPPRSTPFSMMFLDALDASAAADLACPAWIDASVLDQRVSLAENLALSAKTDRRSIERAVASFGPEEATLVAPGWLDRTPANFPHGLPDWVICALKVVAARERGQASIALQASLFAALPETWRAACRQILNDGVIFVLYANPALIGRFGERTALIGDADHLLCWAPIEKDRQDAITAFCRDMAQQPHEPLPVKNDHELFEE